MKPGTRDGQRIRLAGKGNAGTNGGASGDLYLVIKAGVHPLFRRTGDDIALTVPVTVTEAALGAKIDVPTIDTHPGEGGGGHAAEDSARERRLGRSCGCARRVCRVRDA